MSWTHQIEVQRLLRPAKLRIDWHERSLHWYFLESDNWLAPWLQATWCLLGTALRARVESLHRAAKGE